MAMLDQCSNSLEDGKSYNWNTLKTSTPAQSVEFDLERGVTEYQSCSPSGNGTLLWEYYSVSLPWAWMAFCCKMYALSGEGAAT